MIYDFINCELTTVNKIKILNSKLNKKWKIKL